MKHYTELLKIGIPVPKTDLMFEPEKRWNGMENWGLFLFTTGLLTLYSVQFFIVSIFFLENC